MNNENVLMKNRATIDEIDKEMAFLFEKRMNAAKEIAAYKNERGIGVLDKSREASVIEKNSAYISDSEIREYYVNFITSVMSLSRALQSRETEGLKVSFCGAEGAFGYLAAKKAFPSASLFACGDFSEAYKAVEEGKYDCAVLPIENSYAGDVSVVMDLAFSGSLYVNAVIETKVTHNLLLKKGGRPENVKTVVSHPQALEQCGDFLRRNGFKTLEYSNTALAAKFVLKTPPKISAWILPCAASIPINTIPRVSPCFRACRICRSLPIRMKARISFSYSRRKTRRVRWRRRSILSAHTISTCAH